MQFPCSCSLIAIDVIICKRGCLRSLELTWETCYAECFRAFFILLSFISNFTGVNMGKLMDVLAFLYLLFCTSCNTFTLFSQTLMDVLAFLYKGLRERKQK
ncbi:hypothetical protein Zm00014a_029331 [Zea mays]|uniref:Uncharacterized protein n=1 Tax=Zea mays TaxID=4577 RepID=A0A3L6E547_MAIZE|nr:hypothetical protein Zm00014a_029331 [Zea mays]